MKNMSDNSTEKLTGDLIMLKDDSSETQIKCYQLLFTCCTFHVASLSLCKPAQVSDGRL